MKNRATIDNNVMGILASVQLTMESVGFKAEAFLFSDSFSLNIIGDLTIFLEINIGLGAEASFGINGSKVGITPGVGATVGMIVVTDEEEINKKRGMQ